MSLIDPGYGDLLDRLSILDLKLEHLRDVAEGDPRHAQFRKERDKIVERIEATKPGYSTGSHYGSPMAQPERTRPYNELVAVNRELWDLEAALGEAVDVAMDEGTGDAETEAAFGRKAIQIKQRNRRRAELVLELNRLFDENLEPEKL